MKKRKNLLEFNADIFGMKLLKVAMLLRDPTASAQDLQDLLMEGTKEVSNEDQTERVNPEEF